MPTTPMQTTLTALELARPSTPEEYEPSQHVDATVVADVTAWLTTSPSRRLRVAAP